MLIKSWRSDRHEPASFSSVSILVHRWARMYRSANNMTNCYRCGETVLHGEPLDEDIHFFVCPACNSRYAERVGQAPHDRWLMPITLLLYSVIHVRHPEEWGVKIANEFKDRTDLDLEVLVSHIDEELNFPKQRLTDIHEFEHASEDQLREFLKSFRTALCQHVKEAEQAAI